MWLFFGILAIVTAILNIIFTIKGRDSKLFMFASLSLTALTICAFYSQAAQWVGKSDWTALMDVTPSVSVMLWVCTGLSILINAVSFIRRR